MTIKTGVWLLVVAGGALVTNVSPSSASIACTPTKVVQWTPASGGNGHFYSVICAASTWDQANAAAVASGRHLATLTSTAENAFVFSLADNQEFWIFNGTANHGPWIGGTQPGGSPEPAGGWSWVTGETFGFNAWYAGEPNDAGGIENRIEFYDGTGGLVRSAQWADVPATFGLSYVTEWEHSLDIDGDGEVLPLTDGILVLRYLFGFSGVTLTTSAVDLTDCTRCDATAIQPFLARLSGGIVYDVTQDWSNSVNPNGPWSYLQGTTALPQIPSWEPASFSSPQPAWAPAASGNPRIPVFMKSIGAESFARDYLAGDVVIHSQDEISGSGQGVARLRFTAPATGIYRIDLDVWIGRDIGRTVDWSLVVDGAEQDSGTVASGDAFSRAAPDGSSASAALEAGDVVDLVLTTPAAAPGDFVGVRLRLAAFGIDIDGDGESQPLTDGVLVLRRLFGFSGATLINGAVDLLNCTRCNAPAIGGFLDTTGAP